MLWKLLFYGLSLIFHTHRSVVSMSLDFLGADGKSWRDLGEELIGGGGKLNSSLSSSVCNNARFQNQRLYS
jgi:hypothetical protein